MKGSYIALIFAVAVAVAAGVFGGQAGWSLYQERTAAAAAEAASAAAAAEALTIKGQQRRLVAERMNVPESAAFRNDGPSKKKPEFWCGEVSGRNLLGTNVGFVRYTALLRIVGDEVMWADVDFEERNPRTEKDRQLSERVAYQWDVFCADR